MPRSRAPLQPWQLAMLVIAAAAFAVLGIVWLSLGSAIGWVQVALAAVFLAVAFVEGDRRQREDDR